jgi:hypothetical protein
MFKDLLIQVDHGIEKLHESMKCVEYNGIHRYIHQGRSSLWIGPMYANQSLKPTIAILNKKKCSLKGPLNEHLQTKFILSF